MLRGSKILNQNKLILRTDCLVRLKHSNEGIKLKPFGQISSRSSFHQPQTATYPATKQLPLPLNIEDLASSEKLKFSPQRNRDITSSYISSSTSTFIEKKVDSQIPIDERVELYDCTGTINLSSAMQSNVPTPFVSSGKPIHLNMPGGQWGQKEKYVSEELNNVHHTNTQKCNRNGVSLSLWCKTGAANFYFHAPERNFSTLSLFSSQKVGYFKNIHTAVCAMTTDKDADKFKTAPNKVSYKEKLKMAVKEYGPVIMVLHISISLVSLGFFYLLVSSIDLSSALQYFGISDGAGATGTAAGFIAAYGVHKALAPARIALTLTLAPFVVRRLRKQLWWPLRQNAENNVKVVEEIEKKQKKDSPLFQTLNENKNKIGSKTSGQTEKPSSF